MVNQEEVQLFEALYDLVARGLVERQRDVDSGETRWAITPAGEAALEEAKAWT